MTARISFKGGWWADVRTEWPYGADTRIAGAWAFTDDPEAFENACRVTLVESVVDANLPDVDGNAIPFSPAMWDTVSGRIGRKLLAECQGRWSKWHTDADPKDDSETSPG